jgi:hypothetical protein
MIALEQRTLVDESGMIRTQDGDHNTPENGRSFIGRFVRYNPVAVTSM